MVKGIELEPSYIFTHYALGRWNYEVRVCDCDFEDEFKGKYKYIELKN